jgi:hypothetical protein
LQERFEDADALRVRNSFFFGQLRGGNRIHFHASRRMNSSAKRTLLSPIGIPSQRFSAPSLVHRLRSRRWCKVAAEIVSSFISGYSTLSMIVDCYCMNLNMRVQISEREKNGRECALNRVRCVMHRVSRKHSYFAGGIH